MASPFNVPTLPAAVSGTRFEFDSPAGRISAYVAGQGPPLMLVHSVNAAASAAEVLPLHEHYRATRTVYSIDLPGYGFADRSDRAYTPRLMTDALHALRGQIRQRAGSGAGAGAGLGADAPIDALAVSLACEFLARAASERPADYRSLALVSPTGLNGSKRWRGARGSTREVRGLHAALRGPGGAWGGGLFRALTRPGVIRYFLRRTYGGPQIDEDLWRYAVLTTRQPGAENAPLCFLAAAMFSADIQTVYEQLQAPVWMSHGVRGDFTDYRGQDSLQGRPNWRFTVFQTGALPYFEVPQAFFAAYDGFLDGA